MDYKKYFGCSEEEFDKRLDKIIELYKYYERITKNDKRISS